MQTEPEIAFRHVEPSEAVQQQIVDEIDRLDALDESLITCRVMVELGDRRHQTGNQYHVRIDLTRPGAEIVVDRRPPEHRAHEELAQAIGEAFEAARKRLLEDKERSRRDVKQHEEPPTGRVRTKFPELGYGFIEDRVGMEIYFHRNAVRAGSFDDLEEGTRVRFRVEQGEEGPQATFVEPL
jgi:cold shock CspA family protein